VTAVSYLGSTLELLVFVGLLASASAVMRTSLFPGWRGTPARLVELILAITAAVLIGEVLGLIGLLKEIPLLLCAVAVGIAAWRFRSRGAGGGDGAGLAAPLVQPLAVAAGVLVAALVLVKWSLGTLPILDLGMYGFDTMQYHMPLAAGFAQSGSITGLHYFDPTYMSWFDPANSELVHAEALAIVGSDIYSPLMNLGWLALAMLAAWCIGRPYDRPALAVLALSPLLVTPIFLIRQPGEAMSDTAAVALLLCSAAVLVTALASADSPGRRIDASMVPAIFVAALAAGLALGTKANLLPEVFVLALGCVIISVPGIRLRIGAVWLIALLATGGVWYIRNLVVAGNPLPWFELGIGPLSLPATEQVAEAFPAAQSYSIVHYLTDGAVWRDYYIPGLKIALGHVWPLLLALVATGAAGSTFLRISPVQRLLGATALIGLVTYVFSPGTAFGVPGHPALFPTNMRYALPALALALAVLPTLPVFRWPWASVALAAPIAVVLGFNLLADAPLTDPYLGGALVLTALALLAVALTLASRGRFAGPLELALYGLALLGLAVGLYWPQVQQYQDRRYTNVWTSTGLTPSFRWAKEISNARIALAGTAGGSFQYAFYGDDSSNRVVYVGDPGPRGSFNPIETCTAWRQAINAGGFDYLITTPTLNFNTHGLGFAPERGWTVPGPGTTEILRDGPVSIFRIDGTLPLSGCKAKSARFSGVPPLLRSN
jgi:hypothetical protein